MEIVDTHCHIHEAQAGLGTGDGVHSKWLKAGKDDADQIIADAAAAGVTKMVCIGCDVGDSEVAVDFVQSRPRAWAAIGIHPHEAKRYPDGNADLARFAGFATRPKVVAVGECGLDYFYNHSDKRDQERILRFQIELALKYDLPMVFHVRDAFEDFWPIFDSYQGIRGVVHSFTATRKELDQLVERGLYAGINGIITFSKAQAQLEAAKAVPLDRIVIETDAPFLTPAPNRGTICEPKHAATTLQFVAALQGLTDEELATASTANAKLLFGLEG